MIVLDTNVLSELLRPVPDEKVVTWLVAQPRTSLFTTTISRGEMRYGVSLMPEGQRRDRVDREVTDIFAVDMEGRVLAYDSAAADAYAGIAADRRASGRPISQSDAMIAGIARSHGATLATRNLRDFQDCGIALVDPWQG